MVNTVTFPPELGGDGLVITDDDNINTGLLNGGHLLRFVPALKNIVAVCSYTVSQVGQAISSAAAALVSQQAAQNAANSVTQLGSATGLQTTGASVVVNTSAPPTASQILMTDSPTSASWHDAPKTTPDFLLINAGIR